MKNLSLKAGDLGVQLATNKMIFQDIFFTLDTAVSAPWDTLHTPCFAWGRKRGNGGKNFFY